MMVSLLFPVLLASAGGNPPVPPDPPVQVWLNSTEYYRGDRARVYAIAERDGYLVVLHADADGRVRVLFPLDPVDDDFVRGGERIEIRGRGDDDAFLIELESGSGVVLAAWSLDPFRFDDLARGDHWDYRAIAPDGTGDDPEATLLDIANHMAAGRPWDYDTSPYVIGRSGYASGSRSSVNVSFGIGNPYCFGACYSFGYYDWRPGFHLSLSFGSPYYHRPYYYRPFYYSWYDPFRYRPVYWGGPHYWNPVHRPWWDAHYWDRYPRHRRGYGIRFADCWGANCGRYDPPRGKPGRATGVGFGNADWRTAYGLTEPLRDTPSFGRIARQASNQRAATARAFSENIDRSSPQLRRAAASSIRDRGADPAISSAPQRPGSSPDRPDRPDRGIARVREQATQPEARTPVERSTRGIASGTRDRAAQPRASEESSAPPRSRAIVPRTTREVNPGNVGSDSRVRSSTPRASGNDGSQQRIRSAVTRGGQSPDATTRSTTPRSSEPRATTPDSRGSIRSRAQSGTSDRQTGSTQRASGSVSRSSGSINSRVQSGAVRRESASTQRASGSVSRSSGSISRSTGRDAVRSSGSVSRSSGSTQRSSGSVSRSSGSAQRSSGSASRPSGSVSRPSGSASRSSGTASARSSGSISSRASAGRPARSGSARSRSGG
jgi:hypothetical protein